MEVLGCRRLGGVIALLTVANMPTMIGRLSVRRAGIWEVKEAVCREYERGRDKHRRDDKERNRRGDDKDRKGAAPAVTLHAESLH